MTIPSAGRMMPSPPGRGIIRQVAFVRLPPEQRTERLEREPLDGRQWRHFPILLAADEGGTDELGAAATGASRSTVERTRRRFAVEGLDAALSDKPRSGARPPAGQVIVSRLQAVCKDGTRGSRRGRALVRFTHATRPFPLNPNSLEINPARRR